MVLLAPAPLHYTRCPLSCPVRVRVWLWVWVWTCVALSAGQGAAVGRGSTLQDFPIAAEENFYSFNPDGTYTFSYDTGAGEHQSFRIEMRDASGRVSGRYGYVDPSGALRITEYQADSSGYRANIEVYHQVSLAPPAPLLVGPIPKQPTSRPSAAEDRSQPPVMHPVGPAPFFPSQQPVLVIGPLPKPLQPQSDDDDDDLDPPDLSEDSLFTIPSDPLIPAVFPRAPPGDASPRDILNTPLGTEGINILQGTLNNIQQSSDDPKVSLNSSTNQDILQVPQGDLEASQNGTVTPTEKTGHHTESLDAGQTAASSNSQNDRQLPNNPQLLPTLNTPSMTHHENKNINPTTTSLRRIADSNVHATQDHPVSVSGGEGPNYSIINDVLQPSATSIIVPTISRLAERGAKTETKTAIAASPVLMAEENDDTRSQSKTSHNPPPIPPTPSRTYLPVGVPRHQ